MKLYLAVPRRTRHASHETRPAQAREWISSLPLRNGRESLEQLHDALYDINRTDLRTGQRLQLLDLYRSPLRTIRGQVETRLSRGAVPLSGADLAIAESYRDSCVEMAYGYKAIVLEIARSLKRRHLEELRLSMARGLFYLEQTIYASALYRQASPAGIWQEIHTIYCYARQLGLEDDSIRDPVTRVRTPTTISLTYRRALLFGLSDPCHQPVPVMGRILEFLRRNAQNARLKSYAQPPTERCQFVIDLQSDYPARAYVKQHDGDPPRDALLLDTVNLTRHAHDQLKRLTSAEQFGVELDDDFQDELGRKLLEEVVYTWGMIPRRGEERTAADRSPVQVMPGIDAVNFCMNEQKPFQLSTAAHAEHAATGGTFQVRQENRGLPGHASVDCRVLDRCESGLRIAVPYNIPPVGSLRVGDIAAARERNGPWRPALIRWLRCVEDTIEFGVKTLRDPSRPVVVKPVSSGREQPFRMALALFPEEDRTTLLQLVTPPGLYRPQGSLVVDDGGTLFMIRSRTIIERSETVEWFDCEKLHP